MRRIGYLVIPLGIVINYAELVRKRSTAILPKTIAKPTSTSILGTAELNPAPKTISLLKPEVAHPCGVKFARNCIHPGVMNNGHQQPPSGASIRDARTPMELAALCVLTRVASIIENAADITTINSESKITPAGDSPTSILKIKIPAAQKIISWINPFTTVLEKIPPRMVSFLTEVVNKRSNV